MIEELRAFLEEYVQFMDLADHHPESAQADALRWARTLADRGFALAVKITEGNIELAAVLEAATNNEPVHAIVIRGGTESTVYGPYPSYRFFDLLADELADSAAGLDANRDTILRVVIQGDQITEQETLSHQDFWSIAHRTVSLLEGP